MKTPEISGTGNRREDDRRTPKRPARRVHDGPIGFGQVFSMVKRGKGGAHGHGAGSGAHGGEEAARERQRELASGKLIDASIASGTAPTALLLERAMSSGSTLDLASLGIDQQGQRLHAGPAAVQLAEVQQQQTTRVTPQRALELIADVAREFDGERGAKELHLELDPAHLGPIVVRLVVDRGRITTDIRTKRADAAATLAEGAEGLRERLAGLGYAEAEVSVEQDERRFEL